MLPSEVKMSTEWGEVPDAVRPRDISIEVATNYGLIRLFSSQKKVFLDKKGLQKLRELLDIAESTLWK
jgi:hypothetical protein